jgi:hypothetical protein
MASVVEGQPQPGRSSVADTRITRRLVGVSGVALAAQVAMTDYGGADAVAAGLWFVIGCVLLWMLYRRRSRVARAVVIVTSLVGAVVYGVGAPGEARSALLALAYVAQAVPLMSSQVRRHVQAVA